LKSTDLKRLEAENRKLKEVLLNQASLISELKKDLKQGVTLRYTYYDKDWRYQKFCV
jgi:hypothetical protein